MSLKYKVAHIIFNQFFCFACSGIQSAAGNAPAAVPSVIFPARSPLAETDIRGSKTGVEKRRFPVRKIEN